MFTWLNPSWQIFGWAESSYLSYILRPQTGNANGCSWRIWWCLNTQQLRPNLFSVNILVITLNIFYLVELSTSYLSPEVKINR